MNTTNTNKAEIANLKSEIAMNRSDAEAAVDVAAAKIVKLSSGREALHRRMSNGALEAYFADGTPMTSEEWNEYCDLVRPKIVSVTFNRGGHEIKDLVTATTLSDAIKLAVDRKGLGRIRYMGAAAPRRSNVATLFADGQDDNGQHWSGFAKFVAPRITTRRAK